MRYLLFILTIYGTLHSYGQSPIKVIDISKSMDSIYQTIPFNIPIIIKKDLDHFKVIDGVYLVSLKRSKSKKYFEEFVSSNTKDITNIENDYKAKIDTLKFNVKKIDASTEKYEQSIYVPTLKPNKFYDILIFRRPHGAELEEYFTLFKYYHDNKQIIDSSFIYQLKKINILQTPFELLDWNPKNKNGELTLPLDIQHLKDYYIDQDLESLYRKYDATTDTNLKKEIKDKISLTIEFSSPTQDGDYLYPNFNAVESISMTTTEFNFDKRLNSRIIPQFGLVYYGFQDKFSGITPFLGLDIELAYSNKNIPTYLNDRNFPFNRLSINTGVTLSPLKKAGVREDLFSGKSLLIGLSYKMNSYIRISGGSLIFKKEDPNIFIDNMKLTNTPYLGVSLDLNIKALIKDLASIFTIK